VGGDGKILESLQAGEVIKETSLSLLVDRGTFAESGMSTENKEEKR